MLPAIVAAILLIGIVGGASFALNALPPANIQNPEFFNPPPKEKWADIQLQWYEKLSKSWVTYTSNNAWLKPKDQIHFVINANRDCFVYMLYRSAGSEAVDVMYPPGNYPSLCPKGSNHQYPPKEMVDDHQMDALTLEGQPGEDKVIALSFLGQ